MAPDLLNDDPNTTNSVRNLEDGKSVDIFLVSILLDGEVFVDFIDRVREELCEDFIEHI